MATGDTLDLVAYAKNRVAEAGFLTPTSCLLEDQF